MPTKRCRLSRIVPVSLFVFIVSVLVEESDQHILRSHPVESLCLRRCLLRAVKRSHTKVSTFSCYRNCINRSTKDQEALTANAVFKQRVRRQALTPFPECGVSSPDQSVDWSPSVVNVTFGQYDNTSYWYVNVSWTPLNDSYGHWTDIMVKLVAPPSTNEEIFGRRLTCSVHPKNLTFLRINISSLHYEYPRPIYLKVVAFPYSPKEDQTNITTYCPLTSIQSTTGVFPTTTTKKSNCSLEEYGDLVWYSSNVNGCFFRRSNGDWFANISWTPLTNSTVTWTGYFLSFFYGDVPKDSLSSTAQCFKVPKNQNSFLVDSSHGWKPPQSISVSVFAYPFPKTMDNIMHNLDFPAESKCITSPPSTSNTSPPSTSTTPPPTSGNSALIASVFSSVGAVFVFLLITLLLFRRCWHRKPSPSPGQPKPTRFKYHAFIIYSTCDEHFVNNILIPILERYSFKYCIHWKDFPPGQVFTETIVTSVYNSFKIIAVVSENFINSGPCIYEMNQAQCRLMTQNDDCLIVIKYDGVNVTEVLGDPLLQRSYIDYTSIWDRSRWESRLVQVLQKCVLEDESDDCSECNANNNNLAQENSTGDGGRQLFCSCQSAV